MSLKTSTIALLALLAGPALAADDQDGNPALPPLVEEVIEGDQALPDVPPAPAAGGGIVWDKKDDAETTSAPPMDGSSLSGAERVEWLNRLSDYFNGFETLKARFTQLAWDGSTSDGTLKIKRPGKFRFDYDPPVPIFMASDGIWFVMVDRELDSINRLPMLSTPFAPITADNVDLANNRDIVVDEMVLHDNALRLTLGRAEAEGEGTITLYFRTGDNLELTQWKVIDSSGLPTTVVLGEIEKGMFLSNHDFVVLDNNE